jgi:uncharacterized protein involved in cysteine biosynthesis
MLRAFTLALGQLTDPAVLRVLGKSLLITVAIVGLAGAGLWWLAERALSHAGLQEASFAGADAARVLLSLVGVVVAGWLLWRIVALAVLQFFADEVVRAVETRHYPAQAARARQLSWREELRHGLRGAARALGWNLAALPVALVLLVTGLGPALVFLTVNAVLLGRELQDMVWLRHTPGSGANPALDPAVAPPLSGVERLLLGGVVTALLTVPVVNLLAPLLGAAAATHLVHHGKGNHAA